MDRRPTRIVALGSETDLQRWGLLDRRGFLRLSAGAAARWPPRPCSWNVPLPSHPGRPASPATQEFAGVTLDLIGLEGEDGKVELEQWRADRGITLASSPFASWDETFAKLKTDTFDLALVSNPYVSLWGKAGVLTPLDLTRLHQLGSMFPALKDADFLRDEAGNVYAVPIAWGDGPYVYAPERVPTPPHPSRTCSTRPGMVDCSRSMTRSSSSISSRWPRATRRRT